MARKNRRPRYENKDLSNLIINPLSSVDTNVSGTPMGMMPIMALPNVLKKDNENNLQQDDHEERLP